jgi:hypothetical protein
MTDPVAPTATFEADMTMAEISAHPLLNMQRPVKQSSRSWAIGLLLLIPIHASAEPVQPAETPVQGCKQVFPRTPEEFVSRLLPVLNENDPVAVPALLQHSLDVTLHGTLGRRGYTYGYLQTEPCQWYARVYINTSDPKEAHGMRLHVEFGDASKTLRFKGPTDNICLSIDTLSERLKEDNWKMTVIEWEIPVWAYTKGSTLVNVLTNVEAPGGPICASTITITYR